jgi:hypothetical protein
MGTEPTVGAHQDRLVNQGGPTETFTTTSGLPFVAAVVAVALVVLYLIFVAVQWGNVETEPLVYARRSELLGGLEALAFAAAGALLGTTVQRQVTEKAEAEATAARKEADEQRQRAEQNQAEAEKGRALHNLAKAKAGAVPGTRVRGAGSPKPLSTSRNSSTSPPTTISPGLSDIPDRGAMGTAGTSMQAHRPQAGLVRMLLSASPRHDDRFIS